MGGKVRELENSMARMGAQHDVNMELIDTFRHQKETVSVCVRLFVVPKCWSQLNRPEVLVSAAIVCTRAFCSLEPGRTGFVHCPMHVCLCSKLCFSSPRLVLVLLCLAA